VSTLQILVVLLGLLGAAFFAGVETGVISIPRVRLRHLVELGDRPATILEGFLNHPDKLLGTTLVGVNVCVTAASVLAAELGHEWLGPGGEVWAGVTMTVTVLIFSEYLPKAWFQSSPLRRTRLFAGLLRVMYYILLPATRVVNWLTQWIIRGTVKESLPTHLVGTKDALDVFAKEGEEHGVLSPKQRIMIRRVMDLSTRTAAQAMVPRDRIVWAPSRATVAEFVEAARRSNLTRLPIFDEARQAFVGVVNVFDALAAPPAAVVTDLMRLPVFVAGSTPLTEILPRLRLSRQPVCLVTGPGSEVTGLLTTEDLLREIVGKL
jgi:CBS domain containing-hemolysin-like protein